MKKGRLTPYLIVSFLIHTGFLIGAHQFLRLPAEELEPDVLIPVEKVVVRGDPTGSQPEFAAGDLIWPKKIQPTKSQIVMETATAGLSDDIAAPIPKSGRIGPEVTIAGMAATGRFTEAKASENIDKKPVRHNIVYPTKTWELKGSGTFFGKLGNYESAA